jgi:predicted N-acetyltransferase YhbS
VQMSRAWIGVEPVLSLGPIGVLPARQREGIGSSLVRAALDAARDRGEIAVMLLGSQAFYPRFGFRPGSMFGLRNPYAGMVEADFVVEEDDFMIATLDDHGRSFAGEVRWHPAFGEPVEGYADPR